MFVKWADWNRNTVYRQTPADSAVNTGSKALVLKSRVDLFGHRKKNLSRVDLQWFIPIDFFFEVRSHEMQIRHIGFDPNAQGPKVHFVTDSSLLVERVFL